MKIELYLTQIVMLIAGIVIFFVAFKVMKVMFKTLMFVVAIVLIIVSVMGFLVISDVRELKNDVIDNRSIVLLEKDGEYVNALIHDPDEKDYIADKEHLARLNGLEKDELILSYSRLVIMSPEEGENSSAQLLEIEENLFRNPIAIIRAYRSNDITIYPELRTSRALKIVPIRFIQEAYEKVSRKDDESSLDDEGFLSDEDSEAGNSLLDDEQMDIGTDDISGQIIIDETLLSVDDEVIVIPDDGIIK